MRGPVLALLLLAAIPVAAQVPAPSAPLAGLDVDRIVAVVGKHPVLFSELLEQINFARANGMQVPTDSAGQMRVARDILNQMVDQEVLVAVAKDYKIEVIEVDVTVQVEQRLERVRSQFKSDLEFRTALTREGFGTPEEYRKQTVEQAIRAELQKRAMDSLRAKGRLAPANVTEKEVAESFEKLRGELPARPATVGFRQVVVKAQARPDNVLTARLRIDSLRLALETGASFDSLARLHSQDPVSAERGGDLDWTRRGVMVPEFDRMLFAVPPGRISPVVETTFGFHVIRVDRVRAGEVRARHILIKPVVDSEDVAAARVRADSMLAAWREGTTYDTLVARFHDMAEERAIPEGFPRDSLPAEYRVALKDVPPSGFTAVFALPDASSGYNKWAVAQVQSVKPAGAYTLAEYQERIRQQLREERSIRRTLDNLRREFYVSLRL